MKSNCSSQLNACYGSNFNGGKCGSFISCAEKASDPCNAPSCTPSDDCISCISGDLATCTQSKCQADCGGGDTNPGTGGAGNTGSGDGGGTGTSTATCADLSTCCGKISDASAKSSCQMLADSKNEQECSIAYGSLKVLCM
jgi:hypothetical protein